MPERNKSTVSRRDFLGSAVAATALAGAASVPSLSAQARRPNVVFILADDMGWGDLSCYGRPDYVTPHLDRLARQGVRFTEAYAASPVCTPTRCAFLTGRYPARTPVGLMEPLIARKQEGGRTGLDPQQPTVASLLKADGYETALVGKWHLGYLPKFGPLKSGFDEFYGIMSGAADYFTHRDTNGERDFFENEAPVPPERVGYLTELLTERAVEYLKRRRTRPFYLSLHYTAPHWPWQGPGDEQASRAAKPDRGYVGFRSDGSLKAYAAMMKSLDEGVGRVLKTLRETGAERNTLVIFTSDNGGERFSFNWPFTGEKFDLHEGGIRVPAIVRWPGVVPAGRVSEQAAITMDWTATILAAAGTPSDSRYPLDGADMLPVCKGLRTPYERTLFWRNDVQRAVRKGRWKYLKTGGESENLFDLSVDVRENADFKATQPGVLEDLRGEYRKWESQMLPQSKRGDNSSGD
jgi:arylsulfatase A-like enzyme